MINVGVIGCGYWGPNLIRNFHGQPEANLAMISDLDENRLNYVGLQYPGTAKTTDYQDILNNPDIDAVVVATPMSTHYPLGMAVLESGKHLFLEKPMATSSEDCRRLIALAAEKNLVLMVGHTFVFAAAVRKIKSLIDAGDLGELYYVNIERVNLGIFQKDANVVWDLAPHDISMLNFLLGADPVKVSCRGKSYVQTEAGIEDVAFLCLEYPGGKLVNIHVSWLDPNKIRKCTFVGSRKMLVYDDVHPSEKVRVYDKGVDVQPHYDNFGEFQLLYRSGDIFTPHLDTVEPLKAETAHFLELIKGETTALTSGHHGLKVVQVLEQACESMKQGGIPLELNYD